MSVTLTTERLVLRQPAERDVAASAAFWASERSHMMGGPWTAEEHRREFDDLGAQWAKHGFSLFIVTLKGSDDAIGLIGPFYPDSHPEPELGWSLWDASHEGRGLAHEAACAARDWFFANTRYKTAVSYTNIDNTRSHALCDRMGAVVDDDAACPYPPPTRIYRHHATGAAMPNTAGPDAVTRAAAHAAIVLKEHRASIDRLDAILVYTLAERFKHTQAVGRLKAEHALPPSDPAREAAQIARLESLAKDANLDPEFAKKFLTFIISEVIRHHETFQK
jgi:chorismate mutase